MGLTAKTNLVLVLACGLWSAGGCAKKMDDPYAPSSYAPAVESSGETRSAEAEDSDEEAMEPAPSAPPPDAADSAKQEASSREESKARPSSRSPSRESMADGAAVPTGCSDETCMKVCKPYSGAKHTACVVAYNRGCFTDQANPLDCGEFGTTAGGKKDAKDENIGIMPTPKL